MSSKTEPAKRTITSRDLYVALRARLPQQAWALFPEVRNGTGYSRAVRTADAIAMSLWPSRGLDLHGYEFKVSRSDWLAELKQPEKAEAICKYCDKWWLVVANDSIVQPGELPATWGLLVLQGKRLSAKADAQKLDAKPLDRLMLASILRSATANMVPASTLKEEIEAAVKDRLEAERTRTRHAEEAHEALRIAVRKFESAAGVSITWPQRDQWELFRKVREAPGRREIQTTFEHLLNEQTYHCKLLQDAIDALKATNAQTAVPTSIEPHPETQ